MIFVDRGSSFNLWRCSATQATAASIPSPGSDEFMPWLHRALTSILNDDPAGEVKFSDLREEVFAREIPDALAPSVEEILRKHGVLDVAVDLVRETREDA